MEISDLLTPESVVAALRVSQKKQALHELARKAAQATHAPEKLIEDVLTDRERLGSTGIGMGTAIPHGKIAGLDRMVGVFARQRHRVRLLNQA